MTTSRRNFLKKAAVTAPGIALISNAQIPVTGKFANPEEAISDHSHEDGWLNARECGASGSTYQTTAAAKNGSKQITVADVGDFKVGQGIMVSKCNIRYETGVVWSAGLYNRMQAEDSFEISGYEGSKDSWMIYVLDIAPSSETGLSGGQTTLDIHGILKCR